MELRDVLARRRMVRNYREDALPNETLERIAKVIRRAPSAGFSQGHRLIVVTAPDLRRAIADLLGESWLAHAPAHIVHCVSEADYHRRYRQADKLQADGTELEWPVPYWFVDAGALLMLVHLAAIDEGLAAGFVGVPVELMSQFKELLGIASDVAVIGVSTIGHAAPDPEEDRLTSIFRERRRPLDDLVRWER
jgi:FMN reductase [NAD(P)H]